MKALLSTIITLFLSATALAQETPALAPNPHYFCTLRTYAWKGGKSTDVVTQTADLDATWPSGSGPNLTFAGAKGNDQYTLWVAKVEEDDRWMLNYNLLEKNYNPEQPEIKAHMVSTGYFTGDVHIDLSGIFDLGCVLKTK